MICMGSDAGNSIEKEKHKLLYMSIVNNFTILRQSSARGLKRLDLVKLLK